MQDNEIWNITPTVADKIETILYEIQDCSKAIKALFPIYALIYEAINYPDKWIEKLPTLDPPITASGWIGFLLSKKQFKPCVDAAALNWKSAIQMDLSGY